MSALLYVRGSRSLSTSAARLSPAIPTLIASASTTEASPKRSVAVDSNASPSSSSAPAASPGASDAAPNTAAKKYTRGTLSGTTQEPAKDSPARSTTEGLGLLPLALKERKAARDERHLRSIALAKTELYVPAPKVYTQKGHMAGILAQYEEQNRTATTSSTESAVPTVAPTSTIAPAAAREPIPKLERLATPPTPPTEEPRAPSTREAIIQSAMSPLMDDLADPSESPSTNDTEEQRGPALKELEELSDEDFEAAFASFESLVVRDRVLGPDVDEDPKAAAAAIRKTVLARRKASRERSRQRRVKKEAAQRAEGKHGAKPEKKALANARNAKANVVSAVPVSQEVIDLNVPDERAKEAIPSRNWAALMTKHDNAELSPPLAQATNPDSPAATNETTEAPAALESLAAASESTPRNGTRLATKAFKQPSGHVVGLARNVTESNANPKMTGGIVDRNDKPNVKPAKPAVEPADNTFHGLNLNKLPRLTERKVSPSRADHKYQLTFQVVLVPADFNETISVAREHWHVASDQGYFTVRAASRKVLAFGGLGMKEEARTKAEREAWQVAVDAFLASKAAGEVVLPKVVSKQPFRLLLSQVPRKSPGKGGKEDDKGDEAVTSASMVQCYFSASKSNVSKLSVERRHVRNRFIQALYIVVNHIDPELVNPGEWRRLVHYMWC